MKLFHGEVGPRDDVVAVDNGLLCRPREGPRQARDYRLVRRIDH